MTNQTKTSVPFDAQTMIESVQIQDGSISSISNRLEQLEDQVNALVQKIDHLNAAISIQAQIIVERDKEVSMKINTLDNNLNSLNEAVSYQVASMSILRELRPT